MKNKSNNLSRRDFLKLSSIAAIPFTFRNVPLIGRDNIAKALFNEDNDKVLVLVRLSGGNDGLNTFYDLNYYSELNAVREEIMIPETDLITLSNNFAVHPAMVGFKELWDKGSLEIIQNVGYPNQNRSHFRSTDILHSASAADQYITTGWLGRMLDISNPKYPEGYPNNDHPHPFSVTMGRSVSDTCQGVNGNYSIAIEDPSNPEIAYVDVPVNYPEDCYGDVLEYVRITANQTNDFGAVLKEAFDKGNNLSTKYEETGNTKLGTQLKNVARLISGGLQSKIYIVELRSFDTHDNQVISDDKTTGKHANLLLQLADAIDAFQDDLELLGLDHRVIGMTYSEFGRRIRANASLGTDHGTASVQFLFGSCIKNQVLGDYPQFAEEVEVKEGVAMQYDFRNLYGTIMSQWLGAEESEAKDVLYMDYTTLPILKEECINSSTVYDELAMENLMLEAYPNPVLNDLNIRFTSNNQHIKITLFDARGYRIKNICDSQFPMGEHILKTNLHGLPVGSYFLLLESCGISKSYKLLRR